MKEGIAQGSFIPLLIALLLTIVITKLSIESLINLLNRAGCKRINYRGKEVTFGVGAVFIPVCMFMSAFFIIFYSEQLAAYVLYLLGACAIGFAGILDDMIGEKNIKGFLNHIKSSFRGHLTTGFIKAFVGGCVSLILSIGISSNITSLLLNLMNISLFTNTLNLIDLRPGRCTKIFLLLGTIIILLNINNIISFLPLTVMLAAASIYIIYDLREICMLGDVGSNILGICLGFYSSLTSTTTVKVMLFLFLLVFNAAAEKISMTTIISKNKFLSYLDSLGRSS